MNDIQYFSPKELAAELRIPYRLILRAIKNREIKTTYFSGRFRRIHSKAAAAWLDSITK